MLSQGFVQKSIESPSGRDVLMIRCFCFDCCVDDDGLLCDDGASVSRCVR